MGVDTHEEIERLFLEFQAAGITFFQTVRKEPWGAAASARAQAGAHVTLAARPRGEIEAAAQAIVARGDKADAPQLDVTALDAVRRAITAAQPFDVLVNNAGTNR